MEKSLLKLKCRKCESIIDITKKSEEKSCNCGNCTLGIKNDRVYIGSKTGLGDYILINSDGDEYILVSKKELEENNG